MKPKRDAYILDQAASYHDGDNATEDRILSMEEEAMEVGTQEWWDLLNHLLEASCAEDLMPLFEKNEADKLFPEIMTLFEALVEKANDIGPNPHLLAEIVGWQL